MNIQDLSKIKERYAGYSLNSGNAGMANDDRGRLLTEVERLRAVLQDVAEELEDEEPRSHKKIALSIREALKS